MALELNISTLAQLIELAPLDNTVYVFIEDATLSVKDIHALDERFDPDESIRILKQLAIDGKIAVYMPGGMPQEHSDFPTLTKGFMPWNDDDKIEYVLDDKNVVILRKIKSDVEGS